jgi:hypothetical protein
MLAVIQDKIKVHRKHKKQINSKRKSLSHRSGNVYWLPEAKPNVTGKGGSS